MNKILLTLIVLTVWQANTVNAQQVSNPEKTIRLSSSDTRLNAAFSWAVQTALSYTNEGDPVGLWYEAALPERASFCMRDVSHMANGAYYLGLKDYNKNMLGKFAQYISPSRDWCSYWEIHKDDKPTPVDYSSDEDFWYNLPANFDVMYTCYNQYKLTGDTDYLLHEPFASFHRHSVNEYVKTWDSDGDGIMNTPSDRKVIRRGIASYEESLPGISTGSDLVAAQAKGNEVFSALMALSGKMDSAAIYRKKSDELRDKFTKGWRNKQDNSFYGYRMDDGTFSQKRNDIFLLHYDLVIDKNTIREILLNFEKEREDGKGKEGVEGNSYLPMLYYKYNQPNTAYRRMLFMADPSVERRIYPEVSYVFVSTVVEGLMGIGMDVPENILQTTPNLPENQAWAELKNIPWKDGTITVKHEGLESTTLTSDAKTPFTWRAVIPGKYRELLVNGEKVKAKSTKGFNGEPLSFVEVSVNPGESISVSK